MMAKYRVLIISLALLMLLPAFVSLESAYAKIHRARDDGGSIYYQETISDFSIGQGDSGGLTVWSKETASIDRHVVLGPSAGISVNITDQGRRRYGGSGRRYRKYRIFVSVGRNVLPATFPIQVFHTNNRTDLINLVVRAVPEVNSVDNTSLTLNQQSTVTLRGRWFNYAKKTAPSGSIATVTQTGKTDTEWTFSITPRRVGTFYIVLLDKNLNAPIAGRVRETKVRFEVTGEAFPNLAKPTVTRPSVTSVFRINPDIVFQGPNVLSVSGNRGCMNQVNWNYPAGGDTPDEFKVRVSNVVSPGAPRYGFTEIVSNPNAQSHNAFQHDVTAGGKGIHAVRVSACKQTGAYGKVCKDSDPRYLRVVSGGNRASCGPPS